MAREIAGLLHRAASIIFGGVSMISNRSIRNPVLAAAFATAALVGGALQASANVVDTFSVNPNPITEGGTSTIDLALTLFSDYGCNTLTCIGYYNAQFIGGTATIYDGIGGSQSFSIGSGGLNTRDFQLTSTYSNPGTFTPNFTLSLTYSELYKLYQYQYTNCGFFGSCYDVYGWTEYYGSRGVDMADRTNLTVEPTPLPAALPLFATGLGVLGLLGWRRKRKAAAVEA